VLNVARHLVQRALHRAVAIGVEAARAVGWAEVRSPTFSGIDLVGLPFVSPTYALTLYASLQISKSYS